MQAWKEIGEKDLWQNQSIQTWPRNGTDDTISRWHDENSYLAVCPMFKNVDKGYGETWKIKKKKDQNWISRDKTDNV